MLFPGCQIFEFDAILFYYTTSYIILKHGTEKK